MFQSVAVKGLPCVISVPKRSRNSAIYSGWAGQAVPGDEIPIADDFVREGCSCALLVGFQGRVRRAGIALQHASGGED
ncbi:MAG: hypothetical protein ACI9PP_000102 [Halobacteriales archaeon]|jgi:hypothetical protein